MCGRVSMDYCYRMARLMDAYIKKERTRRSFNMIEIEGGRMSSYEADIEWI